MDGPLALFVVGDGAPQRLGGGCAEVLAGQLSDPPHARVVAGWFDLVRHVKCERERPHPRSPDGVNSDRLQYLLVLDAELPPRQLRGHRPVQELRGLPLQLAYGEAPLPGEPQILLGIRLPRSVVQESSQARQGRVEAVNSRQALCRYGHPQSVAVTLLGEPLSREGVGGFEQRAVFHPTDCRVNYPEFVDEVTCVGRRRFSAGATPESALW